MPSFFKKSTLYLLVCLMFLSGCARKEAVKPPVGDQKPENAVITDVASYFPAGGNLTWQFEGRGNEYAEFTRKVLYQEGPLVQITDSNGGTVMGMVFRVSPEEVVKIFAMPEFYEEKNILDTKPNRQEIILKSPLKVGATWQDQNYKREVIGIDETIKLPAGQYDQVVKIKITSLEEANPQNENYEYYAKDIGLVMREFISDDMKVTSMLKTFERPTQVRK